MALTQLTKIDGGGISTTSDYRVGVITATKFVGPIEGAVTGTATTATLAVNAQGLTGTPNIVVGIITASSANFSGNVSIGGTLTYEDVTNIDSVGIITARDGIDCNGDLDVDGHTNLDNVSILGVTTTTVGASGGGSVIRINKDGTSELTAAYNTNAATLAINDTALGAQIVLRGQSPKILFDQTGGGSGSIYWDQTDLRFFSGTPVSGTEIIRFRFTGIKVGSGTTIETNGQATFTGIVTATAFKLANGSDVGTGAGGTWSTYTAGIATSKSVGVNTSNLDDTDLTGIGNSFKGLYISNGMIVHDNVLNGNHYIGTSMNGLMAGPVTIDGNLEIDGNYVVV